MLPQTADYPLKDIQQLYRLANTCRGKLPLSPLITEPLVFTRALCKGTQLTPRWFSRSGLIHPLGLCDHNHHHQYQQKKHLYG